jgi:hypothetical protein
MAFFDIEINKMSEIVLIPFRQYRCKRIKKLINFMISESAQAE